MNGRVAKCMVGAVVAALLLASCAQGALDGSATFRLDARSLAMARGVDDSSNSWTENYTANIFYTYGGTTYEQSEDFSVPIVVQQPDFDNVQFVVGNLPYGEDVTFRMKVYNRDSSGQTQVEEKRIEYISNAVTVTVGTDTPVDMTLTYYDESKDWDAVPFTFTAAIPDWEDFASYEWRYVKLFFYDEKCTEVYANVNAITNKDGMLSYSSKTAKITAGKRFYAGIQVCLADDATGAVGNWYFIGWANGNHVLTGGGAQNTLEFGELKNIETHYNQPAPKTYLNAMFTADNGGVDFTTKDYVYVITVRNDDGDTVAKAQGKPVLVSYSYLLFELELENGMGFESINGTEPLINVDVYENEAAMDDDDELPLYGGEFQEIYFYANTINVLFGQLQ